MPKTATESTFSVVATNAHMAEVAQRARKRLGKSGGSVTLRHAVQWPITRKTASVHDGPLYVLSSLTDIPTRISRLHGDNGCQYLLFTEGMPPAAFAQILNLKVDERHVHLTDKQGTAKEELLVRLFRSGIQLRTSAIVDAWWEWHDGGVFVALSPDFERLRIPAAKLAKWLGEDREKRENFEIDLDGSFVLWPHADAHFGWEQLRYLIDPAAVAAGRQRTREHNVQYGEAIKKVRLAHHLSQAAIPELSDRHVRRVENGTSPATSKFLHAMAAAHDLPVDAYLNEVAQAMSLKN
jgi:hypothetical protein